MAKETEVEKKVKDSLKTLALDLSDMPAQMSKDDYMTVFARVITPEVYALVLGACVNKAIAGNVKAIELIMTQAQGTPTPRMERYSESEEALLKLQDIMLRSGASVEYKLIDG